MSRFLKQLIASFAIGVFIFNSAVFAYDDVDQSNPDFYAIEYLRRNDVLPEKRRFLPDALVSKVEFLQYLVKLNSGDFKPANSAELPFEDTSNDAWYATYIEEGIDLGIVDPEDPKFYPYKKITVLEALELLFNSKSIPIPKKHVGTIPYKDLKNNKGAQGLVMRAIELGIVDPQRGDYFGLYKKVNRQLASRMIYRMDLVDAGTPQPTIGRGNVSDAGLSKIADVWELILNNFVGNETVNRDVLAEAAIKALVDALDDPYSSYLEPKENQNYNDSLDGEIEGIGAFISEGDDGSIVIVSPIADSPAEAAGIKPGDIITKVDGVSTKGASLTETVQRIKGPKGTSVKLTVKRNGRTMTFVIVRDVINIDAVRYQVIGANNIMHIEVLTFNQNLVEEFEDALQIIQNNSQIEGVIIDLRNNPGGLLNAALGLLNYLLPQGLATVQIEYNFFNYEQFSTPAGYLLDLPMVALINQGSASASEIVAGALKDHGVATVIGETSFGKGTVQEINFFDDLSSLKLTIARWLTPDGHSIEGNGIEPDIKVSNPSDHFDNQLDRAISELNKKIR